jgi:hypothetical protein
MVDEICLMYQGEARCAPASGVGDSDSDTDGDSDSDTDGEVELEACDDYDELTANGYVIKEKWDGRNLFTSWQPN